ncbi:transmembrane emp24 domain-containing protein 3-like [Ornithodoros turicata]|uniref:transmembrane emp24 domain-containing protein 3-like n=1 Tax=Ornithodoros turicata TaxID=34597 RepID=UPI003138CA5A
MFSVLLLITLASSVHITVAVELTFELPDNAKQCFHEDIKEGTPSTIEYQVVTGGHYDVDMALEGPGKDQVYKATKRQFDTVKFTASRTGMYTMCFSNEFSTFSNKLVYFNFQVGEEKPLPGLGEHHTAMTKMESSSDSIHNNLNTIVDYQTHHKLREAQGRKRAEDLNSRVMYWSLGETVAILVIFIGQVFILKGFFTDKRPMVST